MKIQNTILGVACMVALGMSSASAAFLVNEGAGTQIYSSAGNHTGTFVTGLSTPLGIAEGGGYVFIAEYGTGKILKYSTAGAGLGVVDNTATAAYGTAGLAFTNGRIQSGLNSAGSVCSSGPDVGTEDGNRATPLTYGTAAIGNWTAGGNPVGANPNGMTLDPNGTGRVAFTTVAANGSGALNYWTPFINFGTYITFAAGSGARGVVAADSNTFYVAMNSLNKVVKLSLSGGTWTQSDWKTGVLAPVGLAIDGGNLYVGSWTSKTITGYSLADASLQSSFNTAAGPQYFIVSAIPEPSTWALLALSLTVVVTLRRRRTA